MIAKPIAFSAEVATLLEACGLPISDLREGASASLFGVFVTDRLVGVVGIEPFGSVGLPRSLAIEDSYRKAGYGRFLVGQIELWASLHGVEALYLLTTTAGGFFAGLGYETIPRSEAPAAIAGTTEFAGLCPSSSTFMRKTRTR